MLLVDRLTEVVPGERLVALKAVTCNEPWYEGLGPDRTEEDFAYPSSLLVESWCQAAGVLATWDEPNPEVLKGRVMLFGGMAGVAFHRSVLPGEVLEHRVRQVYRAEDSALFEGECLSAGESVMTVERIVIAFRPASALGLTEPTGSHETRKR
jgi:3-hydroxyacyl-[acyl-carrier-protein] dehydratase